MKVSLRVSERVNELEPLVEVAGGGDRILAGHRVEHEVDLVRAGRVGDLRHLLHHLLVDRQPAGRDLLIALAPAVIAALVFARALGLGFVGYDDPTSVTANEVVKRGLSGEGLAWALGTFHGSTWLPLTWLSHLLDVSLFGLEPAGHHAVSVAWHALNAALAFLVLRRLTGARWPALAAATLWALHPLRVESVAWVASRKDLVSGTFYLLTLWAWLRWTERPSPWRYLACALTLALGLAAKQVLVTVPFLLLVLDGWPLARFRERSWSKLVVEKLPLLAVAVVAAIVAQRSQASVLDAAGPEVAPGERLINAVAAYGSYLRQTCWPSGLCVSYPMAGLFAAVASALVLVGSTILAVVARRRAPALLVGWLWFLGVLVPMLGLVRFGYYQAHADRFTYLAQLGLVAGLVLGVWQLVNPRRLGRPLAAAAVVGALALASCTWRQIGVWRDDGTLWRHALACADTATARFNLAEERRLAGETDVATEHLARAVELDSDSGLAEGPLGPTTSPPAPTSRRSSSGWGVARRPSRASSARWRSAPDRPRCGCSSPRCSPRPGVRSRAPQCWSRSPGGRARPRGPASSAGGCSVPPVAGARRSTRSRARSSCAPAGHSRPSCSRPRGRKPASRNPGRNEPRGPAYSPRTSPHPPARTEAARAGSPSPAPA